MLWNLARVPTGQAHLAHPASPVSIRHRFRPSPARAAGYYASADFLQRDSGSLTATGSPGVTTKTVSDIPNGYFWVQPDDFTVVHARLAAPFALRLSFVPDPSDVRYRLRPVLPYAACSARRSGFSPLRSRSCPAPLIVYKARERIHRGVADPRLLATPTSWGRVADPNPNHARFFGIRSPSRDRSPL